MNRQYVETTARLVDARLAGLGFKPLPARSGAGVTPYVVGADASKERIKDLIAQMGNITTENDIGIVYYVGHGSVTPSKDDISLAVYDRKVAPDEGIRVGDLISDLAVNEWRDAVTEIPRYVIVLETCYSGNAVLGNAVELALRNGYQRLVKLQNRPIPPQIALIAATEDGDLSRAHELKGANVSAFGSLFARALAEDWSCADSNFDGILTVTELRNYLERGLNRAFALGLIEGEMKPTTESGEYNSFIAYSAEHHWYPGDRANIVQILVKPDAGRHAEIILPTGSSIECPAECTVSLSKNAVGPIKVVSTLADQQPTFTKVKAFFGFKPPRVLRDTVFLGALAKQESRTVAATELTVQ